ncbi:MAG: 4-demethylwyosine synthase TYW1 [Candidatus Woesearchaeota archaeon]
MLPESARQELEKQQYRIIGSHSAIKICGWTKKMIRGEGACYKHSFYGINSSQCMQMTTSLSCANRCVFCWRGFKEPVSKEWKEDIDDPESIIEGGLFAQKKLLEGYKGWKNTIMKIFGDSHEVKHAALSLTGEPIIYPKINELISLLHKKKISTFLVTNGQYPDQLKDLRPVTQLYVSVDAPTKELMKKIDKPLFSDYWKRLEKSLGYLADKKSRTCIRLTMIKGMNMDNIPEYVKLIKKGDPDFVEAKGYMFVGSSRQRLEKENMPFHEDVVDFSRKMEKELEDYEIVGEHILSRAVLLAKKKYKKKGIWFTWIDFEKFFELDGYGENVSSGKGFDIRDYLRQTPKKYVGISGKGTRERIGMYS